MSVPLCVTFVPLREMGRPRPRADRNRLLQGTPGVPVQFRFVQAAWGEPHAQHAQVTIYSQCVIEEKEWLLHGSGLYNPR